uniref:Uncharacterized protein n=1 Tax=Pristionchus pacificus TaxID=54126 RepID=A0A2A6C940_PRIPA|eukprot:PDM74735.1 hypothetical protein PRIPAC_43686 [Pristionchus pacificus]
MKSSPDRAHMGTSLRVGPRRETGSGSDSDESGSGSGPHGDLVPGRAQMGNWFSNGPQIGEE